MGDSNQVGPCQSDDRNSTTRQGIIPTGQTARPSGTDLVTANTCSWITKDKVNLRFLSQNFNSISAMNLSQGLLVKVGALLDQQADFYTVQDLRLNENHNNSRRDAFVDAIQNSTSTRSNTDPVNPYWIFTNRVRIS